MATVLTSVTVEIMPVVVQTITGVLSDVFHRQQTSECIMDERHMKVTDSNSIQGRVRVFPPPYEATGNVSLDRLAFFHVLEQLKTQKRTGWVDQDIPNPESISDHMYRMAILAMCSSDTTLDTTKCILMCLVHDLAEAQVGDIAPREGIPKAEKQRREAEAMHNFVHDMLHGSPAALRIEALWQEYEEGQTPEARYVKGKVELPQMDVHTVTPGEFKSDLDRFEMASQALEYERRHADQKLDSFYDSSVPKINHPEVKAWGADLMNERQELMQERGDD